MHADLLVEFIKFSGTRCRTNHQADIRVEALLYLSIWVARTFVRGYSARMTHMGESLGTDSIETPHQTMIVLRDSSTCYSSILRW